MVLRLLISHLCATGVVKDVMGCCPPVISYLGFLLTCKFACLSSCTGLCHGVLCLQCAIRSNGMPAWPPLLPPVKWCSRVTGIWHGSQARGVLGTPGSLWARLVRYRGRRMWTEGTERRTLHLVWEQEIMTLNGRLWRVSRVYLCCSNKRYAFFL